MAPPAPPVSTAPPTAAPAGVNLSPASLAFYAAGSGSPTIAVTAAQTPNNSTFTLSTTNCGAIVSVAPTSGAGPFTFSALNAGTCSYTIKGNAATATLPITVTTTTVQGS